MQRLLKYGLLLCVLLWFGLGNLFALASYDLQKSASTQGEKTESYTQSSHTHLKKDSALNSIDLSDLQLSFLLEEKSEEKQDDDTNSSSIRIIRKGGTIAVECTCLELCYRSTRQLPFLRYRVDTNLPLYLLIEVFRI